ncbi:MAG: hypothetical protein FJ102_12475, partial [Deltaproteobacteria bacterium]|nr:hypothetical protein [Deltaproteobacteria bacterium]
HAGRAWRIAPSGACLAGAEFDACLRDYWTGQVTLALLESGGARAMSDALMEKTLLATPVDVGHWAGTQGGYVYALAPRRPAGLIALQNVGSVTLAVVTGTLGVMTILLGVWLPPVIIPLEHNPTPRMVDRIIAEDDGAWVHDEAIEATRKAVLFDELARTWSPEARAMAIAERLGLGMGADDAVSKHVGSVTAEEVRARLEELLDDDNGVNVRVR